MLFMRSLAGQDALVDILVIEFEHHREKMSVGIEVAALGSHRDHLPTVVLIIAGITDAVTVAVSLIRIGDALAIVPGIGDPVAVQVGGGMTGVLAARRPDAPALARVTRRAAGADVSTKRRIEVNRRVTVLGDRLV